MDLEGAAEIAGESLRGRDNPMPLERAKLEGNARILEFDAGFLTSKIRRVTADSATGKILGYDCHRRLTRQPMIPTSLPAWVVDLWDGRPPEQNLRDGGMSGCWPAPAVPPAFRGILAPVVIRFVDAVMLW